jgi:ABC-type lipoprotein release transport system permease subunit
VLFQVAPWDPTTLFAVAITILGASLGACLIPVARAIRIDPIAAIRE